MKNRERLLTKNMWQRVVVFACIKSKRKKNTNEKQKKRVKNKNVYFAR